MSPCRRLTTGRQAKARQTCHMYGVADRAHDYIQPAHAPLTDDRCKRRRSLSHFRIDMGSWTSRDSSLTTADDDKVQALHGGQDCDLLLTYGQETGTSAWLLARMSLVTCWKCMGGAVHSNGLSMDCIETGIRWLVRAAAQMGCDCLEALAHNLPSAALRRMRRPDACIRLYMDACPPALQR